MQVNGEGPHKGLCFPGASLASLACGVAAAAHALLPGMQSSCACPGEICGSQAFFLSVVLFADL